MIVDDGSDDGLEEAVRSFLGPKVRYLRIPHRGVSAARNAGIRELVRGIESWAQDEDGIPSPCFEAYQKAVVFIGEFHKLEEGK